MTTSSRKPAGRGRSPRVAGFPLVLAATVLAAAVMLVPSIRLFIEQEQQASQLRSQVEQQRLEVQQLQQERARWDDPAYIRAQTRERLYYLAPGESGYIVLNADASGGTTADAEQQPAPDIQPDQRRWNDTVMHSLIDAGTTGDAAGTEGTGTSSDQQATP